MGNDLRDLQKQERYLRSSFNSLQEFVDKFDKVLHAHQVEIRIQRLEEVFKEFLVVRRKIELVTDSVAVSKTVDQKETEQERAHREVALLQIRDAENEQVIYDMENQYCDLKGVLMSLLPKKTTPEEPERTLQLNDRAAPVNLSRVKLPEIRLPSFNGQLKEWVTFRDSFRSLIHDNCQLTAMDKFTYLRSSLVGEALQEVSTVEMSAANYEVAWDTLEKKYENKKLIVKAHLDSLFAVEGMKRESYESLNKLISDFEKNLSMLEKIGEETANWSTILVHMMCSRLDTATLRHWETHHNSKEVPSYPNLIEFLRSQCSVLQSVAPCKSIMLEEKRSRVSVSHSAIQSAVRCPFCSEAFHSAFRCVKFLKLKVAERQDAARRNKLCINCLSSGHQARFCSRGACHHCQQRHHSLLHNDNRSSVPQAQKRPPFVNQPHSSAPNFQHSQTQPQTQPAGRNPPTSTHTAQPSTSSLPVTHSHSTQPLSTTNQTCTTHNTVALPTNTKTRNREVLLSTSTATHN